jgi:hypothetical protein
VLLLWGWIAAVVLAVGILGIVGYGLLGAVTRLRREVEGAQRDVRPVLAQFQATAARVEAVSARRENRG